MEFGDRSGLEAFLAPSLHQRIVAERIGPITTDLLVRDDEVETS